jgi:hypothetical protein
MAKSTNPAAQDADAVVPETELSLSEADPKGPVAEKKCTSVWASQNADKYARECVKSEYKNIPCPVLRALMGSGLLEWLPGTLTPKAGILKALKDVLGASDAILPTFEGALHGTTDDFDNVKLLDLVKLSGGHAASSGIIGAATSGTGDDNDAFNKDRFKKLMRLARNGQYDAAQWGKAVNMFAADRFITNKLAPQSDLVDLAWSSNPFSWTFLALEYANVLGAFKNANLKGKHSCPDCISKSTVKALWKQAKLPKGFKHANGEDRLDFSISHTLIKGMEITMFPKVTKEMNAEVAKAPAIWAPIKGLVESFCGVNFKDCDWNWPTCGPCGIPGMKKLKTKFGYNEVLKTTEAWKPDKKGKKGKKEVEELPTEA